MSENDVVVVDEGEVMDETQLEEYAELVEELGTRAVRLLLISFANHMALPLISPCLLVWGCNKWFLSALLYHMPTLIAGQSYCQLIVDHCGRLRRFKIRRRGSLPLLAQAASR